MSLSSLILIISLVAVGFSALVINPLSGISDNNLVFSGSIPIADQATTNLFFTYYGRNGEKTQDNLKNYPLLIFVGSPGSSAQYLSLTSMGPLKINTDLSLSANPNSPNQYANTMFIDLTGSGFSFAPENDIASSYPTYGTHLCGAINAFVKGSNLGQSNDIIILGEGTFLRAVPGIQDIDKLKGVVHISGWPQIYAMGKYLGAAGVDMKIFTDSQKIAIESTFISCYNYIRSGKFYEARDCYNTVLNFVQSKTKNINLFDIRLQSNLTQALPLIQYYFSQAANIAKFKAPTTALFESQSALVYNKTYADQAKNYTGPISQFTKDYLSVKHLFITSDSDYLCYRRAVRTWLETQLVFVESQAFKDKSLEDLIVDGVTVGYTKAVKQVSYMEILKAGHFVLQDQNKVMNQLLKSWLDGLSERPQITKMSEESSEEILVLIE